MPFTPLITTKGVKYIKISRNDISGRDNTLSLQELSNLRVKYSDIGIVDYPILLVAEYPTYYLYQVVTTNLTSSADNNILDYSLSVSTGSQFRAAGAGLQTFTMNNVISDAQGYYNSLTSEYTFLGTPSVPLTLSFNTTSSNWAIAPAFYIYSSIQGLLTGSSGASVSMSYAGYFQDSEVIKAVYGSVVNFSSSVSSFKIIQTAATSSSANLVILEPYLTENFEQNDYNILLNNVFDSPIDEFYMDVDYSTNSITAVNFNQILSGSATRAQVKSYYYSLLRHANPRYYGSRLSSAYYNIYTSGSTIYFLNGDSGSYIGDVAYGRTPNIKYLDSTIYEFDWGGSTYPEILGAGAFHLTNILNVNQIGGIEKNERFKEVDVISPDKNNIYNYTIRTNLPPNTLVRPVQYVSTVDISTNLRIISTEFNTPDISSYIIPTYDGSSSIAFVDSASSPNNDIISFIKAYEVEKILVEGESVYSKINTPITGSEIIPIISASISEGNRWFITLYKNLPSPITGTIKPYNYKRDTINPVNGGYDYPLQNKGVYEILRTTGSVSIILSGSVPNDSNGDPLEFGTGTYGIPSLPQKGMLIWKAVSPVSRQNTFAIIDGSTLSGIGKGGLLTSFVKEEIIDNWNYITQKYGINPERSRD